MISFCHIEHLRDGSLEIEGPSTPLGLTCISFYKINLSLVALKRQEVVYIEGLTHQIRPYFDSAQAAKQWTFEAASFLLFTKCGN